MRLIRLAQRLASRRRHHGLRSTPTTDPHGRRPIFEPLETRTMLSGRGFAAYYFEGTDFAQLKTRREDTQINFDWTDSKDGAVTPGGFGARYSGRVMPKFSETYHFYTRSTGGVRVWVDNKLIINDWSVHPLKDNKGSIALQAGVRYDIRIEYFDTTSSPRFELHWMSARQPREVVPTNRLFASHFDDTPPTAPSKLKTTYVTDTAFKFIWNASTDESPGAIVYDVYSGNTRMGATSDLYFTRGSRNPLNNYTVTVRAVDWAGNVSVSEKHLITTTATVGSGSGTGLAARYYDAPDFTNFRLTRTDPQILFGWDGTPFEQGTDRAFSARWEGTVLARYDELYTFSLLTDGAVKLWVGGNLIINEGDASAARELNSAMKLLAGRQYSIRLEYQHTPGKQAMVAASWSSLSTRKQAIPAQQLQPAFEDTIAPTTPLNVRVDTITLNSIAFSWDASTDDIGVVHYDVYRNNQRLGSTSDTTWTDSNLPSDTQYSYSVVAVDGAGRTSAHSTALVARTQAPPNVRNAFSTLGATTFDDSFGIATEGSVITSLDNGDWVKYSRLDFGGGARSVQIKLGASVSGAGGTIELRLGSPTGQLIGSHTVQPTGAYSTRYTQQFSVSSIGGLHDLFVVFKHRSNVAHVESIRFSTQPLLRVMAVGDSITDGQPGRNSYRYFLYQKLINAGYAVDFVGSRIQNRDGNPGNFDFDQNHEGHSGWRADQILSNILGWLQRDNPDVVLLHIGTNDIWQGQSVASTVSEIEQIIDVIRSFNPSIKILVARVIPLVFYESQIAELNIRIDDMIAKRAYPSSTVRLVDMHGNFSLNSDTFDGVHPNDSGAGKMADRWFDVLAEMLA